MFPQIPRKEARRFFSMTSIYTAFFFLMNSSIAFGGDENDPTHLCIQAVADLAKVAAHQEEVATALLAAQTGGSHVEIQEEGVEGRTRGEVSDIRVVDGALVFKIDGKLYEPFYGISVKHLNTVADPAQILIKVSESQKDAAEVLLKAQTEGSHVEIQEEGVEGRTRGEVSDVKLLDGELFFRIDGEPYESFYGISVKLLD